MGGTDLAVHAYGEPDADPGDRPPMTVHEGYGAGYGDSWFVVFRPDGERGEAAALVATESEPRVWEGFRTYRPDLVADIDRSIREPL